MKLCTVLFVAFGSLWSVVDSQDPLPVCPALGCCEDDCCGERTSWDYEMGQCIFDAISPGFFGKHVYGYTYGCMERSCCEDGCCGEGTFFDTATSCCLPSGDVEPEPPIPGYDWRTFWSNITYDCFSRDECGFEPFNDTGVPPQDTKTNSSETCPSCDDSSLAPTAAPTPEPLQVCKGPDIETVSFIPRYGYFVDRPLPKRYRDTLVDALENHGLTVEMFLMLVPLFDSGNLPLSPINKLNYKNLINSKEFRNFVSLQVTLTCQGDTAIYVEMLSLHRRGYTPKPFRGTFGYEDSDPNSKTYGPTAKWSDNCVQVTFKGAARLGLLGRIINAVATGFGTPFIWTEIEYTICCDCTKKIDVRASKIPSHFIYKDTVFVASKDMVKDRSLGDLADFMRTGNREASGETIYTTT